MFATILAQSSASDDSADAIASVIVWGSVLVGIAVSVQVLIRSFFRFRLKASNPWQFAKPYSQYVLATFTGYASDSSKSSTTRTTGASGTIMHINDQLSHVRIKVTSKTTVFNEFTLTDPEGRAMAVSMRNFDAHIGPGQQVSVGWITWKRWNGAYMLVRNHTTGRTYQSTSRGRESPLWSVQFKDKRGWRGIVQKTTWLVGVLGLLLCIPLHIVARLILRARRSAFERHGLRRLEEALDQKAAQMRTFVATRTPAPPTAPAPLAPPPPPVSHAAPAPSTGEELARLFQLHQQGGLTAEEYESAKQRALQSGS